MKEIGNLVDEPSSNLCSSWICPVQVEEHIGGQSSKTDYLGDQRNGAFISYRYGSHLQD